MKTLEELKVYYNTTLMPDIQQLEQQRKKVAFKVVLNSAIILGVAILIALIFLPMVGYDSDAVGFVVIGPVACIGFAYWWGTRKYTSDFKECVIARLVGFIGSDLVYDKGGCIPQHLYEQSKLFTHRVEIYGGDDFVAGRLGQTDLQFSELHTRYTVRTKNGRREVTIFKGLFFVGDFNKHFHGRTVVLPDSAEKMLGGLGRFLQSKNFGRDDLIKMDDPEFEREFAIYGTDQIEARYILTSSLMKRIMDFRKKTGHKIYLSFVSSKVFVAIPYAKNLFEPKIFETLLNFAPIEEYFNDLSVALGIVEDLNLNTRIWTKE